MTYIITRDELEAIRDQIIEAIAKLNMGLENKYLEKIKDLEKRIKKLEEKNNGQR